MRGVYLCARKHRIPGYNIDYNDVKYYPGINILGDCLDVNLLNYDFVIATPPCNYWSKANYRRYTSKISLDTRHLLPSLLIRCLEAGIPFIIENVQNLPLFKTFDLLGIYYFTFGGHTFWTNVLFLVPDSSFSVFQNKANVCQNKRDGNYNVDLIIKLFLETIHNGV